MENEEGKNQAEEKTVSAAPEAGKKGNLGFTKLAEKEQGEKVPFKSAFPLAFADGMCGTLNGLVTGGGFSYFFTKFCGLDEGLAGIVWLIFGIWNALNDPLFGYISDRTKSRLGRRIPYIRYGSVIYAAVFILSWYIWPFGGSQAALFAQMLICLFFFDALYTAIATALYVMPYEMATSNKARGIIFIWKIIFSLISIGVPVVLFPLIKPEPGSDPLKFQLIMTGIGLLAFLIIFFSTFFYKEKGYHQEEKQPSILKSIVACFKNKPFIIFEVISFTVIFAQTIIMQGVIYYFDEFTNVPMLYCYIALGVGAIGGMAMWLTLREKFGMKPMMLIMTGLFAIGCIVVLAGGWELVWALLGFALIGIGFSGGMYLIPIMNGDVIDYDELKTGLRREGMYAGVNSLITKPAISIANAAFLNIIAAFGYDKTLKSGQQSASAKEGILVAWMAILAGLLVLSFLSLCFYPLSGDKWTKTKNELLEKHKMKEEVYEKKEAGNTTAA
jgi:GPH family glycoside/pentoside/hexuronide:cation symporter